MSQGRASEGRRVLRNVAAIGAFAMSPVQMFLLVRSLGASGYGRWWWTFVILEALTILGLLGAELYVRREVPRVDRESGGDDEAMAVVGGSLALTTVSGLALAALVIAVARPLAEAKGDPEIALFLVVLGFQPVLWNVAVVFAAALQARNVLTSVAVLRGIIMPIVQAAALLFAWLGQLGTRWTLLLLLAHSVLGAVAFAVLYGRRLSLTRTLRFMLHPRHARAALHYSTRLFVPALLLTIGARLDLYVLGANAGPTAFGVYAGCIQLGLGVAAVRVLFDPIIQAQIATLYSNDKTELAASLRRLARMSTFAMAPIVVLIVAVGEPILAFLLGRPVPEAVIPLVILGSGQIIAGVAVAAWLVPMMRPGRALAASGAIALGAKLVLLLVLVPTYGAIGAAIATAVALCIGQYSQVWIGSRDLGRRPYSADVVPMLLVTGVVAAAGRVLFLELGAHIDGRVATWIAGGVSLAVLIAVQWRLLTSAERTSFFTVFGIGATVKSAE